MLSFGARKHLEHGLDCCVYFGRSLDIWTGLVSGGIRPFRKRLCSACIMAQAGAAEAIGAGNVLRMGAVPVPAGVECDVRELVLGLDDQRCVCSRMLDLVQIACRYSLSAAQKFAQRNEKGLLEAAGQTVKQKCKWAVVGGRKKTKAVWTCSVLFAERVMLRAASYNAHGITTSKENITHLADAIVQMVEAQNKDTLSTLNPKPQTPNPEPWTRTRALKPETLASSGLARVAQVQILNPNRNPKPKTLNL